MNGDQNNDVLTKLGEDFLRASDAFFVEPVIRWFSFLVEDFGFGIKGFAIAHETSITFHRGDLKIAVIFEIPEIPFVEVYRCSGLRMNTIFQIRLSSSGPSGNLKRAFERTRDSLSIDRFVRLLRSGQLNSLMDRILWAYSLEVKKRLPEILSRSSESCAPQEKNPADSGGSMGGGTDDLGDAEQ